VIRLITKSFFLFILIIFLSFQVSLTEELAPGSKASPFVSFNDAEDSMMQFVSEGHVLGFRKGDVFIASGNHALRVEFINSRVVSPKEEGTAEHKEGRENKAAPMNKVTYKELWRGIDLVYTKPDTGVVKSSYIVKPGAYSASIRLHYNAPVRIDKNRNLVISYETGEMIESKPVAWQEIKGELVPVEVRFRILGQREVGFDVDSYHPKYKLVIDPVLSWNTFMGSSNIDYGKGIAVDGSGNVYVTGYSEGTWGNPIDAYAGGYDAFVAKISPGIQDKDDLLGTWTGQGVYYMDAVGMDWVKMAPPATQITAGDIDGDGIHDLLGIWPSQGCVWVKDSSDSTWDILSSTADWIAADKMRSGGGSSSGMSFQALSSPQGGWAQGPGSLIDYTDLSNQGPWGGNFAPLEQENLFPHQADFEVYRIPGPGEPGFKCREQKNLVPNKFSERERKNRSQSITITSHKALGGFAQYTENRIHLALDVF